MRKDSEMSDECTNTNKKNSELYLLKQQAMQHLQNRKYSYAMVYLTDALNLFNSAIDSEEINTADQMQELIKQIKLPCHKNLSLCYLKLGNYENCIKQCEEVLKIQGNCVKILYRAGIAHISIGDLIEAEKKLKKAYLLEPNQKEVMKALERIQNQKRNKINSMKRLAGQNQRYQSSYRQQPSANKSINNEKSVLGILIMLIKFLLLWPFYIFQSAKGLIMGNQQK